MADIGLNIESVLAGERLELTLEIADAGKRHLTAIVMPSLLGRFERPLKSHLPLVHREGVAPAILHLGAFGLGFSKAITLMRNRPFDKAQYLADARFVQLGSKGFGVK